MTDGSQVLKRQKLHGDLDASSTGETERSSTSEHRRRELADFLRTRREKLKPEQVGLPTISRRRTPGLRREEVAELAGVGTTWYTWLEQARDIQPSSDVLRRLARALKMTPAECRHLFALAGKAYPIDFEPGVEKPSETLINFIELTLNVPAVILGQRWDVLAVNKTMLAYFPQLAEVAQEKRNWLKYIFSSKSNSHIIHWEPTIRRVIAEFRGSVAESLDHPWIIDLVETLKKENVEFEKFWKEHDVLENTPTIVELNVSGFNKRMQFERIIMRPSEDPRMKVLIFRPLE